MTAPRLSVGRAIIGLLSLIGIASADHYEVYTSAQDELPPWASGNTLQLQLSKDSTNYAIIPLTEDLGMHDSAVALEIIQIEGNLKAVGRSNYHEITGSLDVAYMSCDESDDDVERDPMEVLNGLMELSPMAIILFSTSMNWCSLDYEGDLSYTKILSMVDPAEASTVLGHLNETDNGDVVGVTIFGNTTSDIDSDDPGTKNKSTVAMSVLYSITGLITLLFLVIIATGAVRAHRYPERYGPRGPEGGQPRQSRAKGLARAVLETIPIVKFGDRQQPKPDPDLEMDTATVDVPDGTANRAACPQGDQRSMQGAGTSVDNNHHSDTASRNASEADTHLGCSICTEDFQVGEDVRVLPCDHQFHPNCIDPWLINVSGTCPLWYVYRRNALMREDQLSYANQISSRLDLRPGRDNAPDSPNPEGTTALPPPLALEGEEQEVIHTSHRNRLSRVFDVNHLRQATIEEQMEVLRQLREDRINRAASEPATPHAEVDERQQGARFAERLRDRFRILTTSQSPRRRGEC